MMYKKTALAALTWCSLTLLGEAFTIQPRKVSSKVFLVTTPSNSFQRSQHLRMVGRRWAARGDMEEDDDDEEEDDDDEEEDDDDEDEPLGNGVDSVSWLPTVVGENGEQVSGAKEGAEILPLFPLGGFVYTPNTEHVLNIFEPRYRQMYTDILMNGSKRFVVTTSHPTEQGTFAQTGVLFELQDLKEVSEQTADRVKYICNHKVTGRVNIHKILNPEAWTNRDTYLKVEGTILDDSGKLGDESTETKLDEVVPNDVYGTLVAAAAGKEENELRKSFSTLVNMQHDLEEDVRFTKGAIESLAVKDGPGQDGLWQTVRLWQSFADNRLMARQNELQRDFQEKLQEYLKKEKGMNEDELPSSIGFQDLSPALQQEVKELQRRMAVELQPLVLESSLTMQKILEAEDHKARCRLLKFFMDAETKRLNTKKRLKGIFSSSSGSSSSSSGTESSPSSADSSSIPKEEMMLDDKEDEKASRKTDEEESGTKPGSKSIFFDEPDAFQ